MPVRLHEDSDMEVTPDPRTIGSIREANIAIGGPQIIVVDGQHIEAPTRTGLLAYLATVRGAYGRWADVPDGEPADGERDRFIEMRALPMRLAQYNPLRADGDAPAVGLLDAVQGTARTIILGEPGSGKSSALERLAWVTATGSLRQAAEDADAPLVVPVLARLADFRGEGDLIPVLRRALNELGPWTLGDGSVRLLLWATNVRFMLLLDGLNEFERAQVEAGRKAVRGHLRDYGSHAVHLSCRTADFDAEQEQHPELRVLPDAALWTVQELVDDIAHWDADGASDVRDYLRF